MSAIAENLRRQRLPLLTIGTVAVLGAVAWVLVSRTTSQHLGTRDYPVAAPAVEQAEWNIEFSSAPRYGGLNKSQLARYAAQKEKAAGLVQALYDGIFLQPARLTELVKGSFTADASRSFDTTRLGFPDGATDVKTITRTAHIALDPTTAASAIGRVTVVAEADVDERRVEIKHRSTLWMERSGGGWRVIAFDVKQAPIR